MIRELLDRSRRGDRAAFGDLARLYAPLVTGVVLSRVHRFQDAEDLVQETFLRALRQIQTLADSDKIGSWLYGIALNVVREHGRSRSCESTLPAEIPERAVGETNIDVGALKGCLERLPENLREVFILRHIQNLPYKVLGRLRNSTVSAVGERLWKARHLLRECLQGKGALGVSAAGNEVL